MQKCSMTITVLMWWEDEIVSYGDNTLSIPLVALEDSKQKVRKLHIFKSAGPDNLHSRVLKVLAEESLDH